MWKSIFFGYVCPSIGVVMSTLMYAAPIQDLRQALQVGDFGTLNPVPWAVMTGNCLGWIAYSYHTGDPFIFASNVPGMLVSIWLNLGAAKLQYHQAKSQGNGKIFEMGPQERLLLQLVTAWITILIAVEWTCLARGHEIPTIGVLVNINLLFFYAAPLQSMKAIVTEKDSSSIHRPTMIMNWVNTSFWMAYGLVARNDPVIYGPNGIGLAFGLAQGVLCCLYPSRTLPVDVDPQPLLEVTEAVNNIGPESTVVGTPNSPNELL